MIILAIYLILINALSFLLMLVDKYKAQNNLWRIPEATLMLVAGLGGSFGCFFAMETCRHKTKHKKFTIGVPAMMVVHILVVVDILRNL